MVVDVSVDIGSKVALPQERVSAESTQGKELPLVKESLRVEQSQEVELQSQQTMESERAELLQVVAEIERFMEVQQQQLSFFVDDSTGHDVVVVKDRQSEEVIRQIPSEEMLKLAKNMLELSGVLLDTKV